MLNRTRVLIVDDEPQSRRVWRTGLIVRGFEVSDARSGEEVLERLRAETPDVILLDLRTPGMGSLETCAKIRLRSEVPIILMSADQSSRQEVQALATGADDYLVKPVEMDELVARIRAVIRRADALRPRAIASGNVEVWATLKSIWKGMT